MSDRWRDDDRDYGYYDDTAASSMSSHSRGRPRGNDTWRHDGYEENDWKRRRTNDDGVGRPKRIIGMETAQRYFVVRVSQQSLLWWGRRR